jgi:hypothetical protein
MHDEYEILFDQNLDMDWVVKSQVGKQVFRRLSTVRCLATRKAFGNNYSIHQRAVSSPNMTR